MLWPFKKTPTMLVVRGESDGKDLAFPERFARDMAFLYRSSPMPNPDICPLCNVSGVNISHYRDSPLIACAKCGTRESHWPAVRALKDENAELKMTVYEKDVIMEHLETWPGLMQSLDNHWPESIIPTVHGDDQNRDAGARIASLMRWVNELQQENQQLRERVAELEAQLNVAAESCRDERQAMYSALYDCHCLIGRLIPNGHINNTPDIREVKRKADAAIEAYIQTKDQPHAE